MFEITTAHFLLQVTKRLPQHIGHDASAGYHEQKVRHGFHLLPVRFRGEWCQARRYAMADGCVSAKKIKPYSAVRVKCISGNPPSLADGRSNAAPKVRRLSHICKSARGIFSFLRALFHYFFRYSPLTMSPGVLSGSPRSNATMLW